MFESLDELVAPGSEPARRRSFGSPGT
jgi:hypothetical protein